MKSSLKDTSPNEFRPRTGERRRNGRFERTAVNFPASDSRIVTLPGESRGALDFMRLVAAEISHRRSDELIVRNF